MERAKLTYWLAAFSAVSPDPITAFLDHVESLLNTREGTLAHLPEYGVPQFDAVQGPQTLPNMARAIIKVADRYEPRLKLDSWSICDERSIQFEVRLSNGEVMSIVSEWCQNGVIRICH